MQNNENIEHFQDEMQDNENVEHFQEVMKILWNNSR